MATGRFSGDREVSERARSHTSSFILPSNIHSFAIYFCSNARSPTSSVYFSIQHSFFCYFCSNGRSPSSLVYLSNASIAHRPARATTCYLFYIQHSYPRLLFPSYARLPRSSFYLLRTVRSVRVFFTTFFLLISSRYFCFNICLPTSLYSTSFAYSSTRHFFIYIFDCYIHTIWFATREWLCGAHGSSVCGRRWCVQCFGKLLSILGDGDGEEADMGYASMNLREFYFRQSVGGRQS